MEEEVVVDEEEIRKRGIEKLRKGVEKVEEVGVER